MLKYGVKTDLDRDNGDMCCPATVFEGAIGSYIVYGQPQQLRSDQAQWMADMGHDVVVAGGSKLMPQRVVLEPIPGLAEALMKGKSLPRLR